MRERNAAESTRRTRWGNAGAGLPLLYGFLLLLAMAACGEPLPPSASSPPAAVLAPGPAPVVWTARPGVLLRSPDSPPLVLRNLFRRLDVVGRDSLGLLVRCETCLGRTRGYVNEEEVVYRVLPPVVAAQGSLAEFALAIREAARSHDLDALLPVMAADFSFGFIGEQSPDNAFAVWRAEGFTRLDRVPELLDQGLATADSTIWSAPPAFAEDVSYHDLRLGFRRGPGGPWEWIYLIEGLR